MRRWAAVAAGALLMALALNPWTVMGSQIAQRPNPFPWPAMAAWMLAAAFTARWLARRPRLVLTHVVGHLAAAGTGFLLWLSWQGGMASWASPRSWWRHGAAAIRDASTGTLVFALLWWGFLWYWGIRLGERKARREEVAAEFALGLLGWGLCILLMRSAQMQAAPLVPGLFGYFFAGLAAQALAAERPVGRRRAHSSTHASPGAPTLAPAVMLMALTGAASYGLFSVAWGATGGVRTGVDAAAGFLGPRLTAFIEWWFGRPRGSPDLPTDGAGTMAVMAEADGAGSLGSLPMWLKGLMGIGGALLAAAALAAMVWALFVLGRILMARKGGDGRGEAGRQDLPWHRLWFRLLRRRLYRMSTTARRAAAWARAAWRKGRELWHPRDVYGLYQGYLWWGRLVGRPRKPGETPAEYGARIAAEVPQAAPAAAALTGALTAALYGLGGEGPGSDGAQGTMLLRTYRRLFHPAVMAAAWWTRFRRRGAGRGG